MATLKGILARGQMLVRRRRAARLLRVPYSRGKHFRMPSSIYAHGRVLALKVPDEQGVKVAFANIFLDDCYGLERYFAQVKVHSVLDVGANVGLFSLAARIHYPAATIHAYEPDKRLEQYLDAQADVGRFDVKYAAVGRFDGSVRLIRSDDSVLNRTVRDAAGDIHQAAFSVAVADLGGEVDLVKMDCEGAEWDILGDTSTWARVRSLAMEYHLVNGRTHEDAVQVTRGLGFKVLEHATSKGCGIVLATRGAS